MENLNSNERNAMVFSFQISLKLVQWLWLHRRLKIAGFKMYNKKSGLLLNLFGISQIKNCQKYFCTDMKHSDMFS